MYEIILADCPWYYRERLQHGKRKANASAHDHYPCMPVEEICALRVGEIASKDALLYLWWTGPMLVDSLRVIDAWGFDYITQAFVWDKVLTNPGNYTMSQCEFVHVAKRGKIPLPRGVRNARQMVRTEEVTHLSRECVIERRREHSQKPDIIRDRIAAMHPEQTKIELFARERVDGWDGWGLEYPK